MKQGALKLLSESDISLLKNGGLMKVEAPADGCVFLGWDGDVPIEVVTENAFRPGRDTDGLPGNIVPDSRVGIIYRHLEANPNIRVSEIARNTGIEKSGVSWVLQKSTARKHFVRRGYEWAVR